MKETRLSLHQYQIDSEMFVVQVMLAYIYTYCLRAISRQRFGTRIVTEQLEEPVCCNGYVGTPPDCLGMTTCRQTFLCASCKVWHVLLQLTVLLDA